MVLTTGRQLEHWHTGAITRRAAILDTLEPEAIASLSPFDLRKLGIAAGDPIRVATRRRHHRAQGPCRRRSAGRRGLRPLLLRGGGGEHAHETLRWIRSGRFRSSSTARHEWKRSRRVCWSEVRRCRTQHLMRRANGQGRTVRVTGFGAHALRVRGDHGVGNRASPSPGRRRYVGRCQRRGSVMYRWSGRQGAPSTAPIARAHCNWPPRAL